MLASAGIILVSTIIAVLQIPSLVKKNFRRELLAFLGLLSLGTGVGVAKALRVDIPNPLDWISYIFSPLSDLFSSVLSSK